MSSWRYLLGRLDMEGGEEIIEGEVPMDSPQLTRTLSGPHQIKGNIGTPVQRLLDASGRPLLQRWRSTMYAVDPYNRIWTGGFLRDYSIDGPSLSPDVVGFTAYAQDFPYESSWYGVDVDPLDVVRHIWDHVQTRGESNLGLKLANTTSPIRIGTQLEDVNFVTAAGEEVQFEAGPVKLNYWTTDSCGGKVDELAGDTPFDYLEEHDLRSDGTIAHSLKLGYPSIGQRRDEVRLILGEQVGKMPSEDYDGDDSVTRVMVLGSGEGRDRVYAVAAASGQAQLRRTLTIDDKKIKTKTDAQARANSELRRVLALRKGGKIANLVVRDDPDFPADVGDEVLYGGDHDWGAVEQWVKIVKMTRAPGTSDDLLLTVVRADTLSL